MRGPRSTLLLSQQLIPTSFLCGTCYSWVFEPQTGDCLPESLTWCCVVRDGVGSLQLSCEDSPNLGVKVWSTLSSRPHSGLSSSIMDMSQGEQGEHNRALKYPGGFTPLQRRCTSSRGRNFGNYILVSICGYLMPLILLYLAHVAYHIGCSPSCTSSIPCDYIVSLYLKIN